MNYRRIYAQLIERARVDTTEPSRYYECHHVIPKCIGGSNDESNLVYLTGRSHFIAHRLLAKIYNAPWAWEAVLIMMHGQQGAESRITGRTFERVKAMAISHRPSGIRKHSTATKCIISEASKATWVNNEERREALRIRSLEYNNRPEVKAALVVRTQTEAHREQASRTHKGKPKSEIQKMKTATTMKGRPHTEERKQNMSNSRKGKPWTQARIDAQKARKQEVSS